jgi:hypothetical protein
VSSSFFNRGSVPSIDKPVLMNENICRPYDIQQMSTPQYNMEKQIHMLMSITASSDMPSASIIPIVKKKSS